MIWRYIWWRGQKSSNISFNILQVILITLAKYMWQKRFNPLMHNVQKWSSDHFGTLYIKGLSLKTDFSVLILSLQVLQLIMGVSWSRLHPQCLVVIHMRSWKTFSVIQIKKLKDLLKARSCLFHKAMYDFLNWGPFQQGSTCYFV